MDSVCQAWRSQTPRSITDTLQQPRNTTCYIHSSRSNCFIGSCHTSSDLIYRINRYRDGMRCGRSLERSAQRSSRVRRGTSSRLSDTRCKSPLPRFSGYRLTWMQTYRRIASANIISTSRTPPHDFCSAYRPNCTTTTRHEPVRSPSSRRTVSLR